MINEKVKCTTAVENMSCVPNRILLLVHLSAVHLVGLGNVVQVGKCKLQTDGKDGKDSKGDSSSEPNTPRR